MARFSVWVGAVIAVSTLLAGVGGAQGAPLFRGLGRAKFPSSAYGNIYFGRPAKQDSMLFVVGIVGSRSPRGKEFEGTSCAGSLIGKRWVLTAAHCITTPKGVVGPKDVDVYVGSHDFRNGDRVPVERVIRHPDYSKAEIGDDDIALIKLARPPKSGTAFQTIRPLERRNAGEASPGTSVQVAGWGLTEKGVRSQDLRFITLHLVGSKVCNRSILDKRIAELDSGLKVVAENFRIGKSKLNSIRSEILTSGQGPIITDNMVCAGDTSPPPNATLVADSCGADSGGPLFMTRKNQAVQVGIVSWGEGCGVPGLYGVYTRVSQFSSWIAKTQAAFAH